MTKPMKKRILTDQEIPIFRLKTEVHYGIRKRIFDTSIWATDDDWNALYKELNAVTIRINKILMDNGYHNQLR